MRREIPLLRLLTKLKRRTLRSRPPLRAMAASLLLLLMALAGSEATEYQPGAYRHAPEPEKNSGEISSAEICPKGEYVVDFTGRVGAWIDRIGIRCAPPLPSGAMGKPHGAQGSGLGGGGGVAVTNGWYCKAAPIIQITFDTTNGYRMICDVTGTCGPQGGHGLAKSALVEVVPTETWGLPTFRNARMVWLPRASRYGLART